MKPASQPHSSSTLVAPRKQEARSRVTNQTSLHQGRVDERSAGARRFSDLVRAFLAEAGVTRPSEAQIGPARRCAAATVQLEALEQALALGEPIDRLEYSRLDGVLRRSRRDLGIGPAVAPDDDPPEDLDDVLEREGFQRVR